MSDFVVFITIGFFSGAIPWALLIVRISRKIDVRSVGDGNPGTVNAWKSGGFIYGIVALVLEIGKAVLPVYVAFSYIDQGFGITSQIGFSLIAISPVAGHAWSPFLKFKGGKALAVTWGSWIAITGFLALPVGCVVLGLMHLVQKNHAITVTSCVVAFLFVFLPMQTELYIGLFWIMNICIIVFKHISEYSDSFILRKSIRGLRGNKID